MKKNFYGGMLIGSASLMLLVACGGDDKSTVISCTSSEFTELRTHLNFVGALPDEPNVVAQLIDKTSGRDISDGRSTLTCNTNRNECNGTLSTSKVAAGLYTLSAKEKNGRTLGSVAVEIKPNSAAACTGNLHATISNIVKSYVLETPLSGSLDSALRTLMAPNYWNGQNDGDLLLAASQINNLSQGQQSQLRELIKSGHFIILTQAQQTHIDSLSRILGMNSPITLKANQPYVDFYALGSDQSAYIKGFTMMPVNNGNTVSNGLQALDIETEQQKLIRTQAFVDWLNKPQSASSKKLVTTNTRLAQASSGCGDGCVVIQDQPAAVMWTHQYSVAYNTGTCNNKLQGPCNNTYQITADIWPVHIDSSANSISDYFIVQLGSNLAPQACYGWYRNQGMDHENRIAAYWAQHYQYQVATLQADGKTPWAYNDLQINSNYQPNTASSSVNVTTGISWSLSGTGTVGSTGSSVGFTSGVTFSNTQQQTYTAMAATSNVASSATNNPSLAQWDYDAKNYVKNSIVPSNHACGGSGFDFQAIDNTNVATTFSPQATFLWQATNNVRNSLASAQATGTGSVPTLPVSVDLGVLLGWAYWPNASSQCDHDSASSGNNYVLDSDIVGAGENTSSNGMKSLIYDVSCGTNTEFGTMPLGPNNHSGGDGNPGSIYMLNSPIINVPFAALTAASH